MSSPRWHEIEAIFHRVRAVSEGIERDRLLDRECRGDERLRGEVVSLLRYDSAPQPALDDPALHLFSKGSHVGDYEIVRLLGSGGMGQVYEARQFHPERRVALKVLSYGLWSASRLARFRDEAETMARLQHPGVATLFEANTHVLEDVPGGIFPYYTMELLDGGLPLDQFVQQQELSIDQRLRLFTIVCDAVHHGHQHGVIHRDLKPENILVLPSGQPKIIDFGVAKIAGASRPSTQNLILGTLRYMSPEQCQPGTRAVDIRSDLYSLGVILYELLCGQPPYDLAEEPLAVASRIIAETAPTRPSRVVPQLEGDLESVLLKTLEKDPGRRYASVLSLQQDLARVLERRPVLARPQTRRYLLQRFVERHRALTIMTVLALLTLVCAIVGTSMGLYRARRAEVAALAKERETELANAALREATKEADIKRAEAERQSERATVSKRYLRFLLNEVPQALGDNNRFRSVFKAVETEARRNLRDEPVHLGDVLLDLVDSLTAIGFFLDAERLLVDAIALWRQSGEVEPEPLKHLESSLAVLRAKSVEKPAAEDDDELERLLRARLSSLRKQAAPDPRLLSETQLNLGQYLSERGQYEEAEVLIRDALSLRLAEYGSQSAYARHVHGRLAFHFLRSGELEAAEEEARKGCRALEEILGAGHTSVIEAKSVLGAILAARRCQPEADRLFEECLTELNESDRRATPLGAAVFSRYTIALRNDERWAELEAPIRCWIEDTRQRINRGEEHLTELLIDLHLALGSTLESLGHLEDEEASAREALRLARLHDLRQWRFRAASVLATNLQQQSLLLEARDLFAEAVDHLDDFEQPWSLEVAKVFYNFGMVLTALEEWDEAEAHLFKARDLFAELGGEEHVLVQKADKALDELDERSQDS